MTYEAVIYDGLESDTMTGKAVYPTWYNNFYDAISIAHSKEYPVQKVFNKTLANHSEREFYQTQMQQHNTTQIEQELKDLYAIHENIWNLESDLKSGLEERLSLEEIGRRAIKIRDWNNKRIKLKNIMAEKLGCRVREIKQDHVSA